MQGYIAFESACDALAGQVQLDEAGSFSASWGCDLLAHVG